MDTSATAVTSSAAAPHRYANVKWYHAVNTQQKLVEACQDVTRTFYGEDLPRRAGSAERSPSASSGNLAPPTSALQPSCRVFGIEADVQWHPSLETAVMRHDPVPPDTEGIAAAGSSSPRSGNEDLFSLEVFLYTVAQAVQGWKTRAASLSSAAPPGPLSIIVKLDFKAVKAAQLFLSSAEVHTWAGLETLCISSSTASKARRRSSLRLLVTPRVEVSLSDTTAPATASTLPFATPPSVHVELWWNADVVAQPHAAVHPLSFAAAPASAVQLLMARTAHALGQRIPFGFSLGWVLSPREVPTDNSTAPVHYVAYSEKDDVPSMQSFLDGLAVALAGAAPAKKAAEGSAPPRPTSRSHDAKSLTANRGTGVHHSNSSSCGSHSPTSCVHLITFPMLFESVFADAYTEQEKEEAARTSASAGRSAASLAPAAAIACARAAAESRRVASAVVAHALQLFFPPQREGRAHRHCDSREGSEEPTSSAAAANLSRASRCFPTFWKIMHFPLSQPVTSRRAPHEDAAATLPMPAAVEWQADVNAAARAFFPYCTIDG
jgi:hypothetical protein